MPDELPEPAPPADDLQSMQAQLAELVRYSLVLREAAEEIGGRMRTLAGKISMQMFAEAPSLAPAPEPTNIINIRPA